MWEGVWVTRWETDFNPADFCGLKIRVFLVTYHKARATFGRFFWKGLTLTNAF